MMLAPARVAAAMIALLAGGRSAAAQSTSNITYGRALVCPEGVAACQWGQTQRKRSGYIASDLLLDFYAANATAAAAAAQPALIVVHGGAYWTGQKTDAMALNHDHTRNAKSEFTRTWARRSSR